MQDKLFQPLSVGPREARNRVIFGSHTTNYAQHNLLSERHADYYAARAEGGVGIVVLEEHIVHPSDVPYEYALLGYLPETPVAIAAVSKRIHEAGALAIVQLNHNGQQSVSDHRQREIWAPSPVPDVSSREVPKAMEAGDIRAVIEGFALTARHARQGDADGVELQVSDRSLLRQFLSPLTNMRGDQYGGALENRLRFVQETIEAASSALGSDRVLGLRFCADELAPWAGITPEQGVEIARLLTETGRVHYLTVTMGSILSTQMFPFHASMHVPRGYAVNLAAQVKAVVSIPVFAAGRIMTATEAARIVAEEQADGVEMIRPLIADPYLLKLAQEGRADEVRPCIACNQGCQVRSVMNAQIGCNVNPDLLHPQLTTLALPANRRTGATHRPPVIVVGAGPAGMEAARTAALREKHVVLYERANTPGGAVALAAKGPGRDELRLITDYLQEQLEKLHVEMHMGIEVTPEMVMEQRPEAVIVATGARAGVGLLPIPGHDLPHVTTVRRVLSGEPVEGQRVVIIDEASSHGVASVVEQLAAQGRNVTIITEDFYAGRDLAGTHDIVAWMQRTMSLGVETIAHTAVARIEPEQVIVTDRFAPGERAIPADIVVLGTYDYPAQDIYYALKGRVPRLFRAGDCIAPRKIGNAITEGRHAGEQC